MAPPTSAVYTFTRRNTTVSPWRSRRDRSSASSCPLMEADPPLRRKFFTPHLRPCFLSPQILHSQAECYPLGNGGAQMRPRHHRTACGSDAPRNHEFHGLPLLDFLVRLSQRFWVGNPGGWKRITIRVAEGGGIATFANLTKVADGSVPLESFGIFHGRIPKTPLKPACRPLSLPWAGAYG